MLKSFGNLTYRWWERLFSERLAWRLRLLISTSIAAATFGLTWVLYAHTHHYFSFFVISAAFAIALFAGEKLALLYAMVLSIGCDYYFIPPIGGIFENQRSIEHFAIVFITSLVTAIFVGTLRAAFNRLSAAKTAALEATKEAKKATAQMERILALVSHDVRNPLATSRMAVQLLLETPNRVDRQSFMAMVARNLDRADRLIQSLLDITSIRSAGKGIAMNYQYCDLSSQVSYLVEELSLTNKDRLMYMAGEPIWGTWGSDGIRRAMENLITNALKYGDPEFPVMIGLERKDSHAVLSVHNHGNEIAPNDQERLFDFFQRGVQAKDQSKGWGIGLAVVKAVAETHGGKVSVESGNGLGTKFILTIPSRDSLQAHSPQVSV